MSIIDRILERVASKATASACSTGYFCNVGGHPGYCFRFVVRRRLPGDQDQRHLSLTRWDDLPGGSCAAARSALPNPLYQSHEGECGGVPAGRLRPPAAAAELMFEPITYPQIRS